ncbi:exonuclease II Exo2 [Rhodotorula toruloides]
MGIPKFFRFMSERYPLISQLIQENRIPEFDALYLDMNGIIHNCSHPNDDDASFRISEHDIFLAIFNYVAHLFSVIKPQKLFFLAVDGVAPRAKMNQQRSRRFRTAKEAKETLEKAKRRGEEIPEEEGFDSNCITPGTPFMARLSAQLKYFIAKKVSEDADWRGVEIILSGHEVPGEGEHKIMEYIRLAKAQPGYNPNMRHCLYGLDADLIMLGLLSHDPHFCLLREEVTFGPRGGKGKAKSLENQNFYLMHLSLFREYLDHEFSSLKSSLPFDYDLERIIDDFILLNIFVGNDFLPHLPGLHINEGALNKLFEIYKRILPGAGGYLNEHGKLNTPRLQLVLNELGGFERDQFEHEVADFGGGGGGRKGGRRGAEVAAEKARQRGQLVLSESQKHIVDQVASFVLSNLATLPASSSSQLQFPNTLSSHRDRRFLSDFADALKLSVTYDEFNDEGENLVTIRFDNALVELAREEEEEKSDDVKGPLEGVSDESSEGEDSSEAEEIGIVHLSLDGRIRRPSQVKKLNGATGGTDSPAPGLEKVEGEPEWKAAIRRVLNKYVKAEVARELTQAESEAEQEKAIQEKMVEWKKDYYREKLEFAQDDQKAVETLVYRYIEGLQWVLRYYYSGVASWGWFYNYHYAPKITDLKNVDKLSFEFDLGKPFRPFEQLMGVLPDLSSQHIPPAFRDLMSDPTSPIIDFYPTRFEQDMNGKKQEWEAVVKIPFIDEQRLLKAMSTREARLTKEEKSRNLLGESTKFVFDDSVDVTYPSSLPGFFPDLVHNHTRLETFHLPTLEGGLSFRTGLMPGVLLGKDAISGFPSLHTIPHTASLGFHGVNVFQSDSRRETMVISIDNVFEGIKPEDIARLIVGKRTYVNYPMLREALVDAVSDDLFRYEIDSSGLVRPIPHTQNEIYQWKRAADRIEHVYSKSKGCLIGHVEVVVHARVLKGLRREADGSMVKEWEDETEDFALQATVSHITNEDVRYMERPPIPVDIEYPVGTKVFFLGPLFYGVPAQVLDHKDDSLCIRIACFSTDKSENGFFKARLEQVKDAAYHPSHVVARMVGMSGLTLSKITSSLLLYNSGDQRVNVGLNLKFEAKQQKVLGYSRKTESGWEYSTRAIELIREYKASFPEIIATLDTNRGDLTRATDFFPPNTVNERMKALVNWIKEKGVRDFEKVPLFSEQLDKDAVQLIEKFEDKLTATKTLDKIKQARIDNIPRQGVLKPAHSSVRLREQHFSLGDRVITVAETGSVPLSAKGVVVGIQTSFIDVVCDVQFMGGTSLGGRCSNYRGATVTPSAVLNLTEQQYATGQGVPAPAPAPAPVNKNARFRQGPLGGPAVLPAYGLPAGGFHPSPAHAASNGRGRGRGGLNGNVQVMHNPARNVSPQTSFHAVATGKAPAASASSNGQPQSQQQRLGQTLGIRGGMHPLRGGPPHLGRGGFVPHAGAFGVGNHTVPFQAATRGRGGGVAGTGAVPQARGGVAIPPPAVLMQQQGARGGRGGARGAGRGAARGARGGAGHGGAAAPAAANASA